MREENLSQLIHLEGGPIKEVVELFAEYFCKQDPLVLKRLLGDIEKAIILKVLAKVNGNQKEAAATLGLKYTTLNEKIKKYGIRLSYHRIPFSY
ncbi:MAG TPA: helix-turn-helix domain-containing protein [Candidatus Aminicenantes bacterium]|nr:helix-turn-helix domain-containing protein [Acidobacteriota bacterium]HOI45197.1 helix-turn-helix domain-containing protein [Candidatus Aminicenantes bacterium]